MCRTEIESILVEKVHEDHPGRRRHIIVTTLVASIAAYMVQEFGYCYSTSYLSSILFTINT